MKQKLENKQIIMNKNDEINLGPLRISSKSFKFIQFIAKKKKKKSVGFNLDNTTRRKRVIKKKPKSQSITGNNMSSFSDSHTS